MVAARTRHLNLQIHDFLRTGGRDLVIFGAGFDMRPFRLALPAGTRVFGLDFPTVLADRQQRLAGIGIQDPPDVTRTPIADRLAGDDAGQTRCTERSTSPPRCSSPGKE